MTTLHNDRGFPFVAGEIFLGSIIRDPKEKLPGYKGEATVVVKSGHAMVVPTEKAP